MVWINVWTEPQNLSYNSQFYDQWVILGKAQMTYTSAEKCFEIWIT